MKRIFFKQYVDLKRIVNKKVLLYEETKMRRFVKKVGEPAKEGPCLYGSLFHRLEAFCTKDVLRNYAKCTGKHLCQRLFFNKVAGQGLGLQLY